MEKNSSKSFKERIEKVKTTRWIRFAVVSLIFFFWVVWLNNYWVLLVYPLLFDIYITLYIPWNWWKKSENKTVRTVMSWVDSIVYALILVYFIFAFVGQNYKIPSSSLEKTLLVGDYLWVNKMCYGPRVPQTPLHFPLVQNTFPIINTKSYFDKPQFAYHRLKGVRNIERNDIVVFNYPAGDTIVFNVQNPDYYTICYKIGEDLLAQNPLSDKNFLEKGSYEYGQRCLAVGREYVKLEKGRFGEVIYRPVDRRENYVKRAIGLPGDYMKIVDNVFYINGKPLEEPENVQFNYFIRTDGTQITDIVWEEAGVSIADRSYQPQNIDYYGKQNLVYAVPLTYSMVKYFEALPYVEEVERVPAMEVLPVYPIVKDYGWTRANYAANLDKGIWIPKKGCSLELNMYNLPIYERAIKNYEGNDLQVRDGKIYINGEETTRYKFKMDYYWMVGDNRDNSADSRYWGFVPEDHIVGTPMFVIISIDGDKGFFSGFRWDRMFKDANPDK